MPKLAAVFVFSSVLGEHLPSVSRPFLCDVSLPEERRPDHARCHVLRVHSRLALASLKQPILTVSAGVATGNFMRKGVSLVIHTHKCRRPCPVVRFQQFRNLVKVSHRYMPF